MINHQPVVFFNLNCHSQRSARMLSENRFTGKLAKQIPSSRVVCGCVAGLLCMLCSRDDDRPSQQLVPAAAMTCWSDGGSSPALVAAYY